MQTHSEINDSKDTRPCGKDIMRFYLNLLRFSTDVNPVNVTTQTSQGASMAVTMKTFYSRNLLENARATMVFTPLGKKYPLKGNKIELRKFNTFPKALTPLTEGVIPTGENFGMTNLEISTNQHGDYVAISDRLELEAFDDVIFGATEEMGAAEGETYDILTRNKILTGTNVVFAPNGSTPATARQALTASNILTPTLVNKIATWFKKNRVPKFDGYWLMVIHPSQSYDLRESQEWKEFHKYDDVAPIFKGEIGTLHGFRFIEDPNVKVYWGANLASDSRTILLNGAISAGTATTFNFDGGTVAKDALVGRELLVGTNKITVTANTTSSVTFASQTLAAVADNTVIYPGEGGAAGVATYGALALGKDGFAVLDPEGEGMELIIKDRGEIGGPLEQFSTIGYKFNHGAGITYQERVLRVETGSTYSSEDEGN